jgi:hypothetical protein
MGRMQKAEQVNEIVAGVIKDVVSKCDKCKLEAQIRLAEAFQMMNKPEQAAEMRPSSSEADIIDVEEVEEDTHDQAGLMADVIDVNR